MAGIDNTEYIYDPVKEIKGGVEATKVIWSTKAIERALDAINKGLPLKTNPFCGTNVKLLKPDLVYQRTEEEIQDYIKCMQDPVYFAEKCFLMTPEGLQAVKMRDYQVEYLKALKEHRFNVLLSARQSGKSVTTAIFALWKILFNVDKTGLILSKSGSAGQDLLKKIKDMYMYLPYYLKCGTLKWNQTSISFDNNSTLYTEAFSTTAGVGSTLNLVILDEFAWCDPNAVDLFYENVIPTVTTISDSNVCIMSTQNGHNKFYEICKSAWEGRSIYHFSKIDWYQVPQWNPITKKWEKRTEEWKKMMVGVLGSEEAFYYQYGTQFAASDKCLVSRELLSKLNNKAVLFKDGNEDLYSSLYNKFFFIKPNYDIKNFKTKFYIILCDLSEGGGADSTVFNIFEVNVNSKEEVTFEQVAYWKSNTVDLEYSTLELWLLCGQLFDKENFLVSIEWNTYGALFYNYLMNLNENDYKTEYTWRFNYAEEFDVSRIISYKKGNQDEEIAGFAKNSKVIPGIRWSGATKKTGCALTKMLLEKGEIDLWDITQVGELENFEDKNGNGSYEASYGHDDMMMTVVQIPMLKQTNKFKEFIEDYKEQTLLGILNATSKDNNYYSFGSAAFTQCKW